MKTLNYIGAFSAFVLCWIMSSCMTDEVLICSEEHSQEMEKPSLQKNVPSGEMADVRQLSQDEKITTEIRWYALENADNAAYWQEVDQSQLWVAFAPTTDPESEEVKSFLSDAHLGSVTRSSNNPEVNNYRIYEVPGADKESVLHAVNLAKQHSFILFAEPLARYSSDFDPNDLYWQQGEQWGPYVIYADVAWESVTGGSFNVIAVIDDAVDFQHEDLVDQVQYGWDYGFNDADPSPDDPSQIHGTHVTGTIAATINNNIGIAGMVNDTVFFAKVTDDTYDPEVGNFSNAAIVDALFDIASISRVGVVNMSLGSPTPSAALEEACNAVWNAGKLIVVASGNDGTNVIGFPAAYEACVAVGSIGTDGNSLYLAPYSQFGNQQEVVAPGGDSNTGFPIVSTIPGDQYGYLQGTSMACPHVAGLAGMLFALDDQLTNVEARTVLASTSFDMGDTGWDPVFGFGMVNAEGAVNAVLNGSTTDISEAPKMSGLLAYPNPVHNQLNLTVPDSRGQTRLTLTDMNGRIVDQKTLNSGSIQYSWDAQSWTAGTYLLRVSQPEGTEVLHILKSN